MQSSLTPHSSKAGASSADAVRDLAHEALRASESRYRRLFETARDGILLLNAETAQIEDVNPYLVNMLGYSHDEFLGKKLWEVGPFADIAQSKEMFAELQDKGYVRYEDLPLKAKTGTRVQVEFVSNAYDCEGVRIIQCNIRNITERKLAEQGFLRESIRNQAFLRNASDGVHILDADGNVLEVSDSFCDLLGYSREDLIGAHVSLWSVLTPPQELKRVIARLVAKEGRSVFETKYRCRDGSVLDVEVTSQSLELDGKPVIFNSARDISDRIRTQDELRRLNQSLEQRIAERTYALQMANAELEAFSYSVSHDLRAPLRTIQGFSQLLQEQYADKVDEPGKKMLRRVNAAAARMGHLIDALLKLSRISVQKMQRGPVDLSALAREIAEELKGDAPERKAEWNIAPQVVAQGDRDLLRVVLQNLLDNAWKYSSKRDAVRIEFGVAEKDGRPAYFVRDNGAGFDMAYSDKLFGPFQRLHSPSEFPGTGIGLATVARIVHRHGGEVWADGRVGEGACFYFTL